MLELTGVASVLRGISILYWLLAAGALALVLWKVRRWWGKAVGALIVVCVFGFFPVQRLIEANKREAYAREAWAYFKKLCDEKSGQKIYKTFTGVKSVLVVKPLPPATEKDLYDQFWYGDPYSAPAHSQRGMSESVSLIGTLETRGFKPKTSAESTGFDFVEVVETVGAEQLFSQYSLPDPKGSPSRVAIAKPVSRFAISWEDISTPDNRNYWVAGSRLRVIDLTDNSIVAERIGFFIEAGFGSQAGARRPWLTSRGPNTTCPSLKTLDFDDRFFIHEALNPAEEIRHGQ
jgi:hypothetical protein